MTTQNVLESLLGINAAVRRGTKLRTFQPFLQLLRPPNLVTAAADILAGYATTGLAAAPAIVPLIGGGMALYGGGVVLNDFFDRGIDALERPERPIPSGRVAPVHAAILGFLLLGLGVLLACFCSAATAVVAVALAGCVILYDSCAKHYALAGPIVMGLCRGLNLLLGLSVAPAMLGQRWWLAALPIVYIAAFTTISRGEVNGGSRRSILTAGILFAGVCGAVLFLGLNPNFQLIWAVPVVLFLLYRILPAIGRAYRNPDVENVRAAVKAGVLSLIVLNAAITAGYAGPWYGAVVLALLGVASALARIFAVT